MNKEEIEEIETLEIDFKDTDELELALEVSSKKAIYLIDDLIKHLFELQQENKKLNGSIQTYDILLKANTEENKILKENAEHNDKVVDKVNWENNLLKQQNQKYKEVIDKAINNSQYWIDYYTRLNSDERIVLRLQENIDILKEVK